MNFRFLVIWLFISIGSLHAQEAPPLSFSAELISPELFNSLLAIEEVVEGEDGHLWLPTKSGLKCYDGKITLNYIYDEASEEFVISNEKVYYKYLQLVDSTYLWFSELHKFRAFCFNIKTRAIEHVEDFDEKSMGIYLAGDKKKAFALNSERETLRISIKELGNDDGLDVETELYAKNKDYIYHENCHWVKCIDIGWRVLDSEGNLINEEGIFPRNIYKFDGKLYQLEQETLYELKVEQENKIVRSPVLSIPKGLGNFLYVLPQDERFWIIDDVRTILLYDPKQNTFEDYTSLVNEICTEKAPQAMSNSYSKFYKTPKEDLLMTNGNSILKLSPLPDLEENFLEPIPFNKDICSMRGLAEDSKGNIYASFYTGVSVINQDGSYTQFDDTHEAIKTKNATYNLTIKDDVLVWNHNVFNLKDGTKDAFLFDGYGSHVNHLLDNDTLYVFHWISNLWGKYVVPEKKFEVVNQRIHPARLSVSDMTFDKSGSLVYLSTNVAGILAINRQGQLADSIRLSEMGLDRDFNEFYDLHIEDDSLWFSFTQGLGVYNLKTRKFNIFSSPYVNDNGQKVNRTIYSILPDSLGNFYLGSNFGLLYYDKAKEEILLLDEKHPLAKKEFNRGSTLRSTSGKYYVGTINGLYAFFPSDLKFEANIEQTIKPFITQVSIRNKDEQKNRNYSAHLNDNFSITVQPDDNYLKIDFSTLNSSLDNFNSYRLRGVDDSWSAFTPNQFIEFYTLPVGTYFLDIQSTFDPSTTAESVSSIKITKLQVWYKRWYVIALFFLSLLSVAMLFIRSRYQQKLRRQKEMEGLRNKISSDLHDDVGSILTGLAMQSEMMSYEADSEQKQSLKEMADMSRDAMERMRDTVWAIDSAKDTFKDLVARIHSFAERNLSRKGISYRLNTQRIDDEISISPELRQNVYLVAKESMTNILKHSNADSVDINLEINEDVLKLSVSDNGEVSSSLNEINAASGLGTNNMRRRAQQLNGTLLLEIDKGFKVIMEVPFKK